MGLWHNQDGRHARVTYWRSVIAESAEAAHYRELYSARMNQHPDYSNAKRDGETK